MVFTDEDQEMSDAPWFIIYTKEACPYCDMAKNLMKKNGNSFTEIKLGTDITREEFVFTFPGVKTAPFIIIDGEHIGGYDKLTEWYNGNR